MKNFFYKLNEKYLRSFKSNVQFKFKEQYIRSDVSLLKGIFSEINELFNKIGGRVSSKKDIPQPNQYPDSKKFNRLITDIGSDLDKLYTGQKLVEDDVKNLINFNSGQRSRIFEELIQLQQRVLSLYIKSKQGINGEVTKIESFESQEAIGQGSSNVMVDSNRGVLTLGYSKNPEIIKPVDTRGVRLFFSNEKNAYNLYPNSQELFPGSHWKIPKKSIAHFIDVTNEGEIKDYKDLMIDDPDNNKSVGFCEFEAVRTQMDVPIVLKNPNSFSFGTFRFNLPKSFYFPTRLIAIKKFIGDVLNKDEETFYVDEENSMQKKYSTGSFIDKENEEFKLVIPFNSAPITNQITIKFEPNAKGYYPLVDWKKSKVFSNTGSFESGYSLVQPKKESENGIYNCNIVSFIVPTRIELILKYNSDSWYQIPYFMSHYQYTYQSKYLLPQEQNQNVTLRLFKTYDVYVESEANELSESTRAVQVLVNSLRK